MEDSTRQFYLRRDMAGETQGSLRKERVGKKRSRAHSVRETGDMGGGVFWRKVGEGGGGGGLFSQRVGNSKMRKSQERNEPRKVGAGSTQASGSRVGRLQKLAKSRVKKPW